MTIMYERVVAPSNEFRPRTLVRVRLVAADEGEGAGYNQGAATVIAGVTDQLLLESSLFVVDVDPNTEIDPPGTVYEILRAVPGWPAPPPVTFTAPVEPAPSSTTQDVTLPASNVAAPTPGFPSSGAIYLGGHLVEYTGTTPTAFTGCSGGEGPVPAGTAVRRAHWIPDFLDDPPAGLTSPHTANPLGAHAGSAIAATPRPVLTEANVDGQLGQADAALAEHRSDIDAEVLDRIADVNAEQGRAEAVEATKAAKAANEVITGNWTHEGSTKFDGAAQFRDRPYADATHAGALGNDAADNAGILATLEPRAQEQFWPSGTYRFGSAVVGANKSLPAKSKTVLVNQVSNTAGTAFTSSSFTTAADRLTLMEIANYTGAAITSITDTAGRTWDLVGTVIASTIRLSVYRCMAAGTGTVTINFAASQSGVRWHITETPNVPTGANGANAIGTARTTAVNTVTSVSPDPVFSGFGSGVHMSVMLDANSAMEPGPFMTELIDGGGGTAPFRLQSSWSKNPIVPSTTWTGNRLVLAIAFEVKSTTTAVVGNAGETLRLQRGAVFKPLANEVVQIAGRIPDDVDWQIFDESLGGRVTLAYGSHTRRVRPEWWGAVGDGPANDTAAVRAAKNAVRGRGGKGRIVFTAGKTYAIDVTNDPLTNPLHIDEQFTAWQIEIPEGCTVKARTNALTHYQIVNVDRAQNGAIFGGGTLYGDLETHTYTSLPPHALNQYGHCIQIMGGRDIRLRDVTLTKAWGDGAYVAEHGSTATRSEDIYFENVDLVDNRREGLGLMDGKNVWLVGCKLNDSGYTTNLLDPNANTGPRSGLDVEPNSSEMVEDLFVIACQFRNNAGRGINAAGEAYGLGSKKWYFFGGDCSNNGWGGGGDDDGACFGYISDLFVSSMLFADNVEIGFLVMGACNGSFVNLRSLRNGTSGYRVDQLPAGYRLSFQGCRSAGNAAYGWDLGPGAGGGEVIVDFVWSEGDATGAGLECVRITGNVRIDGGRITKGMDEIQRVALTGGPTGGNAQLTLEGQTTANIAWNAAASAVQAALEALSNVGAGNVEVTGGPWPNSAMRVRFRGALAGTSRAQMTATHTLTGGSSPAVAVSTVQNGGGNPTYLVRVNAGSTAQLHNIDGVGTGTTGVLNDLATGTVLKGCTGTLASEATTTAVVASGATSATVNHGCVKAPTHVTITPTNSMGNATKAWVTNKTATQVTVNVNVDPGVTTATFDLLSRVS